jgi:transcription antitermination factor NusG
MYAADPWYLIRTKSNKERIVREQLAPIVSDIFLPMLKLPITRSHHASLVPLFPQYIFARLHLATQFFEVRYMPGVTGFVSSGCEPLSV